MHVVKHENRFAERMSNLHPCRCLKPTWTALSMLVTLALPWARAWSRKLQRHHPTSSAPGPYTHWHQGCWGSQYFTNNRSCPMLEKGERESRMMVLAQQDPFLHLQTCTQKQSRKQGNLIKPVQKGLKTPRKALHSSGWGNGLPKASGSKMAQAAETLPCAVLFGERREQSLCVISPLHTELSRRLACPVSTVDLQGLNGGIVLQLLLSRTRSAVRHSLQKLFSVEEHFNCLLTQWHPCRCL